MGVLYNNIYGFDIIFGDIFETHLDATSVDNFDANFNDTFDATFNIIFDATFIASSVYIYGDIAVDIDIAEIIARKSLLRIRNPRHQQNAHDCIDFRLF